MMAFQHSAQPFMVCLGLQLPAAGPIWKLGPSRGLRVRVMAHDELPPA